MPLLLTLFIVVIVMVSGTDKPSPHRPQTGTKDNTLGPGEKSGQNPSAQSSQLVTTPAHRRTSTRAGYTSSKGRGVLLGPKPQRAATSPTHRPAGRAPKSGSARRTLTPKTAADAAANPARLMCVLPPASIQTEHQAVVVVVIAVVVLPV